jgi:hypothetical protein
MSSRPAGPIKLFVLLLALLGGCVSQMKDAMPEQAALPPDQEEAADLPDLPAANRQEAPQKSENPAAPSVPQRRARAAPPPPPPPPPPEALLAEPMEEVLVMPGSLTGYWRLSAAHSIDVEIGLFSGVQIRYGGEWLDRNICWLQQSGRRLDAVCSSGVALKTAEGSVDEDGVTMRWWMGPANIIFSGKLTEAGRIKGGFSGGVVGLKVTGNVPAIMTRLDLPPDEAQPSADPDRPSAALLRAVWEDVRAGHLSEGRYEAAAIKRVDQGLSADIAADPPRRLLYLGQILIRWRKEQRELIEDVYQVRSGRGRHLCRIGISAGRQVTDFNCGTLPG